MRKAIRKQILLLADILVICALLSGCMLARPEAAGNGSGDLFSGFWLVYDRFENDDKHVFDVNSQTEQMLLTYMEVPGDGKEPWYNLKAGSSLGDVSQHINVSDEDGEHREIKGTIYLLDDEDRSIQEQAAREIWLYGDVVQSFRDYYVSPPESMSGDDVIPAGETVIVYIPRDEIDMHGPELLQLAKSAGIQLVLKSESPRRLTVIPVYQRADGTLYEDEFSMRFTMDDSTSHTQSVEQKQTVGGKTIKKGNSVTISARMVDRLEKVRILEMDAQNTMLRASDVTLNDIQALTAAQEPFQAGEGCAYLMVEETYRTKHGDTYVKRTVYNQAKAGDFSNQLHTFHFPLDNGLTESASMNISF